MAFISRRQARRAAIRETECSPARHREDSSAEEDATGHQNNCHVPYSGHRTPGRVRDNAIVRATHVESRNSGFGKRFDNVYMAVK